MRTINNQDAIGKYTTHDTIDPMSSHSDQKIKSILKHDYASLDAASLQGGPKKVVGKSQ